MSDATPNTPAPAATWGRHTGKYTVSDGRYELTLVDQGSEYAVTVSGYPQITIRAASMEDAFDRVYDAMEFTQQPG